MGRRTKQFFLTPREKLSDILMRFPEMTAGLITDDLEVQVLVVEIAGCHLGCWRSNETAMSHVRCTHLLGLPQATRHRVRVPHQEPTATARPPGASITTPGAASARPAGKAAAVDRQTPNVGARCGAWPPTTHQRLFAESYAGPEGAKGEGRPRPLGTVGEADSCPPGSVPLRRGAPPRPVVKMPAGGHCHYHAIKRPTKSIGAPIPCAPSLRRTPKRSLPTSHAISPGRAGCRPRPMGSRQALKRRRAPKNFSIALRKNRFGDTGDRLRSRSEPRSLATRMRHSRRLAQRGALGTNQGGFG